MKNVKYTYTLKPCQIQWLKADRKLDVVKQVKTLTGTSLREAKQMGESCPTPLKEAVSEADAEKIKIEIERAGGSVAIKNDV